MKRIILASIISLILATTAGAAVFNVTPVSDNDCSDYNCDLQSALTASASDRQNDIITMAAGTYHFPSTIIYKPTSKSGENFSLTIIGAGKGATIVDGGANAQLLTIDTTLLAEGSLATIIIKDLTITGSGDVKIVSNASVTVNDSVSISAGSITFMASDIVLNGTITTSGTATLKTGAPALSGTGLIISTAGGTVCVLNSCGTGSVIPPASTVLISNGWLPVINPTITLRMDEIKIITKAGSTVTLDVAKNLKLDNFTSNGCKQISGPSVTLSDPMSFAPTFVVPPVPGNEVTFKFEHTAVDNLGGVIVSPFTVTASDNGITNFPTAAVTFKSATNDNMGLRINNGVVTSLVPVDPATLTNNTNKPSNFKFGLVDLQINVDKPGGPATVTVFLPAPAPAGYKWYKYNSQKGWYDFSDFAVFNADRTQVTLTLVDGGTGDDDGVANGVIKDPSGLATDSSAAAGGGSGGCFIATAAFGSVLHPYVATLRAFRDAFLMTNPVGKTFVEFYYKYSPPAADFIARHDILRFIVRVCLLPAIAVSWIALKFGLFALLSILLLPVIMLCAWFVYKGFKRKIPQCVRQQLT